ncbi:AAA family ATPase [Mesorhizobium sp. GR13]|uniref:AAA family ATPase n=1 Tax=Mesorhizobium sp. GR13 TaxID=2562308 RepID=UPI001FEE015E|nr:AAA family ATPase [Mesorhizobium sp. GR13]
MLDAIALAAMAPIVAESSGFRPYALIRRVTSGDSPRSASITADVVVHPQDLDGGLKGLKEAVRTSGANVERRGDLEILKANQDSDPAWNGMYDNSSPAFLMVGYGATRRVETNAQVDEGFRARTRSPRYERIASLFEDHYTLRPLSSWLPDWQFKNPGRYKQVVTLINKLSMEHIKFTGRIEGGEYLFEVGRNLVPFSAMSDGFKAFIGWIGDMLYHVCMGCPTGKRLVDNKGVVLVDEIDLHIHPEWQQTMIPILARALPNLQFVFTSHSPLVVGSLERANVIHVVTGANGTAKMVRPDEEIFGKTADQILRSDMFGLSTTRAPAFRAQLDKLAAAATAGDRDAALNFMRQAARGSGAEDATLPSKRREMPSWLKR